MCVQKETNRLLFFSLSFLLFVAPASARDWHVTPRGTADGDGSLDKPLDITTALTATNRVKPGDTILLKGGTYTHPNRSPGSYGFEVKLIGTPQKTIQVRAVQGERVTIDGGLLVAKPSTHLWVRDLEITALEPIKESNLTGGAATDLKRPWGGLEIRAGTGCKYINLVIHNAMQGVGFWSEAVDSELYGCLIHDNGWQDKTRHHGHAIYTQNQNGLKTISNCILSARRARTDGSYTLHGYAEKGHVSNFLVEDNIAYGVGPFLIGGGQPNKDNRVRRNYLYDVSLMVGYGKRPNVNCEIRDNVVVNGELKVGNFEKVVNEGNLVVAKSEKRPTDAKTVLLPNAYDPQRAHLAVYNWDRKKTVDVKVAPFLKPGDVYRLLDPKDFYGKPVFQGKCTGETISVPTEGEFAAFVVLKGN